MCYKTQINERECAIQDNLAMQRAPPETSQGQEKEEIQVHNNMH